MSLSGLNKLGQQGMLFFLSRKIPHRMENEGPEVPPLEGPNKFNEVIACMMSKINSGGKFKVVTKSTGCTIVL